MTPPNLEASYRLCRDVARGSDSSFYYSFALLPNEKRRAMHALYAFLRKSDDLADDMGSADCAARHERLAAWRNDLAAALDGDSSGDPILPAMVDTLRRYAIPVEYLTACLDGVEMDLRGERYETFADLERYCYRVASVVGLACIHIWGFKGSEALAPARDCGVAFQLTNILRDLGEDAERGRIYLPAEDFRRFSLDPDGLCNGAAKHTRRDDALLSLLRFEIARAEEYYQRGRELARWLEPGGQRIFAAMFHTYHALNRKIALAPERVFEGRVHLPRWRKLALVARHWLLPGMFRGPARNGKRA